MAVGTASSSALAIASFPTFKYDYMDRFDAGGFSTVFVGRQKYSQQYVAVKLIHKVDAVKKFEDIGSRQAVSDEFETQARCNHVYVVACLETFLHSDYVVNVSEYCKYGNAMSFLLEAASFPIFASNSFVYQILLALGYVHSNGLAHRDVKLENIYIQSIGFDFAHFKLGDFGLCRAAHLNEGCRTWCGTPHYMAPEVLTVRSTNCEYGRQADMWSYGISSYIVWTSESPFTEGNLQEQVSRGSISWSPDLQQQHREYLNLVLNRTPMYRVSSSDLLQRVGFNSKSCQFSI